MSKRFELRPIKPEERFEVAELIYLSLNHWHQTHGRSAIFHDGPRIAEVFYDTYQELTPDHNVIAVHPETQRIMGSCFYHPREHHVSLGVMTVHPNYFGHGVGRALVDYIIDFTEQNNYPALRLVSSAINLDSFSLYNRAGFVPRCFYQDMIIPVPGDGFPHSVPEAKRVRAATLDDVSAMAALEMDISGIQREMDYRYCIENRAGYWNVMVYEGDQGIDGFLISSSHLAMRVLGPCLARTAKEALALLCRGLDLYRGQTPVLIPPGEETELVSTLYSWGAKNVELHLCSVRGQFQPFRGISMPTFLPETG